MYIATTIEHAAIFGMGETVAEAIRDADTAGGSSESQGYEWITYEATPELADLVEEQGGGSDIEWELTPDGIADIRRDS